MKMGGGAEKAGSPQLPLVDGPFRKIGVSLP